MACYDNEGLGLVLSVGAGSGYVSVYVDGLWSHQLVSRLYSTHSGISSQVLLT